VSSYAAVVETALQATVIQSPTDYTWFGRPSQRVPSEVAAAMGPDNARAFLLHSLQTRLYNDFYCPGLAAPMPETGQKFTLPAFTPFVQALSIANQGRGAREPGWTFHGEDSGRLIVSRDGLRVWADRRDVFSVKRKLAPGARVAVRMPKELLKLSPGYYMALGETEFPVDGAKGVVRFYWNLRSDGAADFMAAMTAQLNRTSIPFRLKVVNEPDLYTRCDAGVLYVPKKDYRAVATVVRSVCAEITPHLKPLTPVFTKALEPGLGLAEDPGSGDSFGMSRCRLLAEAMVQSYELDKRALPDRLAQVERCFAEARISLDAPYLNAGSVDGYTLPDL